MIRSPEFRRLVRHRTCHDLAKAVLNRLMAWYGQGWKGHATRRHPTIATGLK
jgi:hypothetical protein